MKKTIAMLLALLLVAVMLPVTAMAAEGDVAKIGETGYPTLEAAFAAVTNSTATTITLLKDADVTNIIRIESGKNITLALNGNNVTFTIESKFFRVCNAMLTVTGSGTIKEQKPYFSPIIIKGGPEGSVNYSVVNIKEGVTLEGWAGVMVDQTSDTSNNYGMVLNVENATLKGVNDTSGASGTAIYVNGVVADAKISVTNAALTGTGTCMYLAGNAETTINGGSVTGDITGIEIRAGKLVLNNCDVTGGHGEVTAVANGNGATVSNAALAVSQHTTKKPIDVTVNGGSFSGGAAVYEANPQNNSTTDTAKVKINVTGGAFKGVIAKDEDNSTIAITGGIYYSYVHNQEDLAKFVPEGSEIIFDGISDGVQVKPKNTTIVIIQPTEDKPAEDQKNPSTGANDFVGIAAAMAIVSVVGAAAVSRKK